MKIIWCRTAVTFIEVEMSFGRISSHVRVYFFELFYHKIETFTMFAADSVTCHPTLFSFKPFSLTFY